MIWPASTDSSLIQLPDPGGELSDPIIAGFQLQQPNGRLVGPSADLVDGRPVLPGQPGQPRAPLRNLLQPTRLGLQVAQKAGQLTGDISQQIAGFAEPLPKAGQHVIGRPLLQGPARGSDRAQRPAGLVLGAGDERQRGRCRRPQVVGRVQPRRLGRQRDVLAGLGRHLLDLGQAEPQEVDLPGPALRLGPQPPQLGRRGPALGEVRGVGGQHRRNALAGEPVQQRALAVGGGQPNLLGLTVDGDQSLGHPGAHGGGHLRAAQVRPGSSHSR